jgi:glycosyltransferase involved in cell wall biosynthesis
MLVSIVIPAYNARRLLAECLRSLENQDYSQFQVIVNDDPRSSDGTGELADEMRDAGMNIKYLCENTSMAQGRLRGAQAAEGELILHLDADMEVSRGLLAECVDLIDSGCDALVVPELSFGSTFWARCRWLERKCYEGVEPLEALRCVRSEIYSEIGGHNPEMVYFEDKDFDIRVQNRGYEIGRTTEIIYHNEGHLLLKDILRKRVDYARSAVVAARYYPEEIRWRASMSNRYGLFFENRRLFISHPVLGLGTLFMKTCEFAVSGLFFLISSRRSSTPRQAGEPEIL